MIWTIRNLSIGIASPYAGSYMGMLLLSDNGFYGMLCRALLFLMDVCLLKAFGYETRRRLDCRIGAGVCLGAVFLLLPSLKLGSDTAFLFGASHFFLILAAVLLFENVRFELALLYVIKGIVITTTERIIAIFALPEAATGFEAVKAYFQMYSASVLMAFVLTLGVAVCLIRSRKGMKINQKIKDVPQWVYLVLSLMLWLASAEKGIGSAVLPMENKLASADVFLDNMGAVFFLIISIFTVIMIIQRTQIKKTNDMLKQSMQEQIKQYDRLQAKQLETRKLMHDYSAHLHVLKMMLNENQDSMESYISSLQKSISLSKYIDTGNAVADAIVNEYAERCRKEKIRYDVMGRLMPDIGISDVDLCILLSNGIANAFEAAIQYQKVNLASDSKTDIPGIQIEFTNYKNKQFISIKNPVLDENLDFKNKKRTTMKADKDAHGFGMLNMEEAIQRAGGKISWNVESENEAKTVAADMEIPIL